MKLSVSLFPIDFVRVLGFLSSIHTNYFIELQVSLSVKIEPEPEALVSLSRNHAKLLTTKARN